MKVTRKRYDAEDDALAKSPNAGSYIVTHNGQLESIEFEDPQHFSTEEEAVAYAESQARDFPGLPFVIAEITTVIAARIQKEIETTTQ